MPVFTQDPISTEYSMHFQQAESYLYHRGMEKEKEYSYLTFQSLPQQLANFESLTPHLDSHSAPQPLLALQDFSSSGYFSFFPFFLYLIFPLYLFYINAAAPMIYPTCLIVSVCHTETIFLCPSLSLSLPPSFPLSPFVSLSLPQRCFVIGS